ncbi:DUF6415 family natural product biosynthesis protein [Streptomyces sp. NPDC005890]|uniref:DUF6415 family natural product biosynthesis protein n=1 Tax=Streptomyces sp. NPDC005890 TaxID=3154568 RepID=UPI0033C666EB
MRATTARLLGPDDAPDAFPPAADELLTLLSTLHGHLQLLIPEVEAITAKLPEDDIPRYCARACIGEARGKLSVQPKPDHTSKVAYARRLARVLNALCDHYETLGKP